MARQNTNAEVFKDVSEVGLIRDKTAGAGVLTSTLLQAEAVGATTITVQSGDGASAAAGDLVRIGSEDMLEENVVASVAGDIVTLRMPLAYAHVAGEAAVERIRIDLGEPTDDGIRVRSSADLNPIRIATRRLPYTRLLRGVEYEMEWSIVNFNLLNLAAGRGIPESNVGGSGTTNAPEYLRMLDSLLSSEANVTMYMKAAVKDGTTYEIQCWAVDMDPTDDQTYRSGEGTPIRMSGSGKNIQATRPALP